MEESTTVNGTLSSVTQYTYGHDLISQRRWSNGQWTTHFMGYDGHGSVRFLTDKDGNVTDTLDYDSFGILVDRTGNTPLNYMYAGEQWDPDLGMYYNRARYLNVNTGRFWTQDSYEGDLGSPLSLHKYLYAHSNPVNNLDPTGQFITVKEVLIVATILLSFAYHNLFLNASDAYAPTLDPLGDYTSTVRLNAIHTELRFIAGLITLVGFGAKSAIRVAKTAKYPAPKGINEGDYVYHGTDNVSAKELIRTGPDLNKLITTGGGRGLADEKGLSFSKNYSDAFDFAAGKTALRNAMGGNGQLTPVVIRVQVGKVPLAGGAEATKIGVGVDPGEFFIPAGNFRYVGGGVFEYATPPSVPK